MILSENIKSALRCLAIGDAFGYPYEFRKNIKDSVVEKNVVRRITDDTQMTMYGFEAMYHAEKFGVDPLQSIRDSYIAWFKCQDEGESSSYSDLSCVKELNRVMSPGITCIESLLCLSENEPVINESMGCGSVMRVLPFIDKPAIAIKSGLITHKHIFNVVAISSLIESYRSIMSGDIPTYKPVNHISELGLGWTAPEAVEMSKWAYSTSSSFEELLDKGILHDGDSDSVAAIACSMWGISGKDGWQKYWKNVEEHEMIDYFINKWESV